MEWKLFDAAVPEPAGHLAARGWMDLENQPGWAQRSAMVAGLVRLICQVRLVRSITDLGCGDGSLLALLASPCDNWHIPAWGYDLCAEDVAHGRARGLDARHGDILGPGLEYGELLVAAEVLEHLEDPGKFLEALPGRLLVASSPALETGDWHNSIHAWAWDAGGYRDLFERSGWTVAYHTDCDGGRNSFGGTEGPQRFQAVVAVR